MYYNFRHTFVPYRFHCKLCFKKEYGHTGKHVIITFSEQLTGLDIGLVARMGSEYYGKKVTHTRFH